MWRFVLRGLYTQPCGNGLREWFYDSEEVRANYVGVDGGLAAQIATGLLHGEVGQIIHEQGSIPLTVSSQRIAFIGKRKVLEPGVDIGGVVLNQRAVFEHSNLGRLLEKDVYKHNAKVSLDWSRQPDRTFQEPQGESMSTRKVTGAIILDALRDKTMLNPLSPEASAMIIRTGVIFNNHQEGCGKEPGRYFNPTATFVVPSGLDNFVTAHWHEDYSTRTPVGHREKPMFDSRKVDSLRAAITELTSPDSPYELISPAGIILPESDGSQFQKLNDRSLGHYYPRPSDVHVEWRLPLAGELDQLQ